LEIDTKIQKSYIKDKKELLGFSGVARGQVVVRAPERIITLFAVI